MSRPRGKKWRNRRAEEMAIDLLVVFSKGPIAKTPAFGISHISWESNEIFDRLLAKGLIEEEPGSRDIDGRLHAKYAGLYRITKLGKQAIEHRRDLNKLLGVEEEKPRVPLLTDSDLMGGSA